MLNRIRLRHILIIAMLARVVAMFVLVDIGKAFYWEYGEIAKNVVAGKGYSFHTRGGDTPVDMYIPAGVPFPSAYMPPGYVMFLVPFLHIENIELRNSLLLFVQLVISMATILLLYNLACRLFDETIGKLSALGFALLPDVIYAVTSFTPTVIYHFLVLLLFTLLLDIKQSRSPILLLGALLGSLILLRAEFAVAAALLLTGLFFYWSRRNSVLVAIVVVAIMTPWIARNYIQFDRFIPLTTGAGLNFYRGHNPVGPKSFGLGHAKDLRYQIDNDMFEINANERLQKMAFDYIADNPGQELVNSVRKVIWFFSYMPYYDLSKNPLYVAPTVILSLFWLYGLWQTWSWPKYWPFYLFFASTLIVITLFFPLPRYHTMMKILMLPFAAVGFRQLVARLGK